LSEEEVWCAPGVAMTGNAFPFTDRQAILWATDFRREPSIAMLEVAYAIEDDVKGTTVVNSLGAAGSVSRSHIHLLGETNQFFASIPKSMLDPEQLHIGPEELGDCELWRLDPPFPITAVGVRGAPPQRARVVHHLLGSRSTSSFNLIGSHQTCWLVPRSAIETPAPHFNQALGGAELWGRWCFTDREAYERATSAELEAALRLAGTPWA